MWHGDAESNYLLETTAQEAVDEFIDNQLKRKLQLFLQAPYVDPAHPTKTTSTGRVKVWVIPKDVFFSRFPSEKEQLSAIGAKVGKGVDMYDQRRLTFIDEDVTKKYEKELRPQYSKLREEPDWATSVKEEILERRESKGLRNPKSPDEKNNFYVSRSGNYTLKDPTTKLLVAYDSSDNEFGQQLHNEIVKKGVAARLEYLRTKFKGKKMFLCGHYSW